MTPTRDEQAHYELMAWLMGKAWADRDASERATLAIRFAAAAASRAKARETYATLTKGPWKPPR